MILGKLGEKLDEGVLKQHGLRNDFIKVFAGTILNGGFVTYAVAQPGNKFDENKVIGYIFTEEGGAGNVKYYGFTDQKELDKGFQNWWSPRVWFDQNGNFQGQRQGTNGLALKTINGAAEKSFQEWNSNKKK